MKNMNKKIVQISFKDLFGQNFNGHDLQRYFNSIHIDSLQAVMIKESNDRNTYQFSIWNNSNDFVSNIISYNPWVVHLHLIHCIPYFDISYLPILCSIVPVVWTIHDLWAVTGHCVHPYTCTKWKKLCYDCQNYEYPIPIVHDNVSISNYSKKYHIQRSDFTTIVASNFMRDRISRSPIFNNKDINVIPFGMNHDIFHAEPSCVVRRKLQIPEDELVLFGRTEREHKGLGILRDLLNGLAEKYNFTFISVGEKGLLSLNKNIKHLDLGWIDNKKLPDYYNASNLILMPSECEAFGVMAIEAMSCGKFVIALDSNDSALPEVINSPHCGLSVSRNDLINAVNYFIKNRNIIKEHENKSYEYAKINYNFYSYANKIYNLYLEANKKFKYSNDKYLVIDQILKNFLIDKKEHKNIFYKGGHAKRIINNIIRILQRRK